MSLTQRNESSVMKTCEDWVRLSIRKWCCVLEGDLGWKTDVGGMGLEAQWRLSALQLMNSAFVLCLDIKSTLTRTRTFFSASVIMLRCAFYCPLEKQEVSLDWKHLPLPKLNLKITSPRNTGFNPKAEQAAVGETYLLLSYPPKAPAQGQVHTEQRSGMEGTECGYLWAS